LSGKVSRFFSHLLSAEGIDGLTRVLARENRPEKMADVLGKLNINDTANYFDPESRITIIANI
jgi:hypothetical protein